MKWILLPGFDGTGQLFAPLLRSLPANVEPVVISYPCDRPSSAEELLALILSHLPKTEPYVLLAESFSGPLALKAASLHSQRPVAVVLCASFVQCPLSRILMRTLGAVGIILTSIRPPRFLVRRFLLEGASPEILSLFYHAISAVSPHVLANRFSVLAEFDQRFAPPQMNCPLLYLQATRDRLIGESNFELIRHRYPETQLEKIEAPHLIFQVKPEAATQAIFRFLDPRRLSTVSST